MREINRGPTGRMFTPQIDREIENMSFYWVTNFYACIVENRLEA